MEDSLCSIINLKLDGGFYADLRVRPDASGDDLSTISQQKLLCSIDARKQLSYSKPSVGRAMSILKKNGYITMDSGGSISLTETGSSIAGPYIPDMPFCRRC